MQHHIRRPWMAFCVWMTLTAVAGAAPYFVTDQVVPMNDGAMLRVSVRVPLTTPTMEGFPALVVMHGGGGVTKDHPSVVSVAETFAEDEFVTMAYTVREQGGSTGGAQTATYQRHLDDLRAMKTWLETFFEVDPARFGITGFSQGGLFSYLAATDPTFGFKAAAPESWSHRNFTAGLVSNGSMSFRTTGYPTLASYLEDYDAVGLLDAVETNFDDDISSIDIPVLVTHALLDTVGQGGFTLMDYEEMTSAPDKLVYLGFGVHDTPETDALYFADLRDRWLKHYLRGDDNGITDEPAYHFALHSRTGDHEHYTTDEFPGEDSHELTYYLHESDKLELFAPRTDQPHNSFVNDFTTTHSLVDAFSLSSNVTSVTAVLPQDQLVYLTDPLKNDLLVVGYPRARLYVDGTGSHYQVNVHLTDEDPGTGDTLFLSFGTYLVRRSEFPTGATIDIDLAFTAARIQAGHRVCLQITNLDIQETDPIAPKEVVRYVPYFEYSENQVHHSPSKPSRLTLPFIGDPLVISNGVGGGIFYQPSTWIGGAVPGPDDRILVQKGDIVLMDADATVKEVDVHPLGTLVGGQGVQRRLTVGDDFVIGGDNWSLNPYGGPAESSAVWDSYD